MFPSAPGRGGRPRLEMPRLIPHPEDISDGRTAPAARPSLLPPPGPPRSSLSRSLALLALSLPRAHSAHQDNGHPSPPVLTKYLHIAQSLPQFLFSPSFWASHPPAVPHLRYITITLGCSALSTSEPRRLCQRGQKASRTRRLCFPNWLASDTVVQWHACCPLSAPSAPCTNVCSEPHNSHALARIRSPAAHATVPSSSSHFFPVPSRAEQ